MAGIDLSAQCDPAGSRSSSSVERLRHQHQPDEIVAKLRHVGILVGQGLLLHEAVKEIGVSWSTYYRWRAGQSPASLNKPELPKANKFDTVQSLEEENTRLRLAVIDLMFEKQELKLGLQLRL